MSWLDHVDWAAVVAALVALFNAFQHKQNAAVQQQNHAETMATLKGPAP
jgi:hypothetical protein